MSRSLRVGSVTGFSSGDAGDIDINTGSLEILGGGLIETATIGSPGRGGNLTIVADSLLVDSGGDVFQRDFEGSSLGFAGIFAEAFPEDSGPAGNIDITAGTLVLRGGGAAIAGLTGGDHPGGECRR